MRLPYILLTTAVLAAAGRAAATSCGEAPWANGYLSPLEGGITEVPIDAHPWKLVSCHDGPTTTLANCNFLDEASKDVISAAVEMTTTAACDAAYDELPGDTSANVIFTFTPATPLTPSHSYSLECEDNIFGSYQGTVQVRGDATASAPPAALELIEARYSRDDNGCCGLGDDIEIDVEGLDAAYLAEGGYIEAVLTSGQRFVFGSYPGQIVVPAGDDHVTLTPVSAAGVRGKSIEINLDEIGGDLVYIPCSIATRTSPAALWLLAPFVWIFAHGKRRRRAV